MELQLKNIGMIKEANVKVDGLTVIAGENDTGKSTVGKALFVIMQGLPQVENKNSELLLGFEYDFIFKQIFKQDKLEKDGLISLNTKHAKYYMEDDNGHTISGTNTFYKDEYFKGIIFVESPIVWNLQDFFNTSSQIESQLKMVGEEINIPYPFLMKTLHFQLHTQKKSNDKNFQSIRNDLISIINGEFLKEKQTDTFYFHREEKIFDVINVATGIKYFGLFQVLLDNNRLNKDTVLILDEPEVHLHPKWQLEMAKIIVELVKNGVKVLVNSHSPYMIEALQRYAEVEKVTADFYLAEDGYIKKENDSNSETLAKIFEKLSEPFDVFEEMDSQKMEQLING